MKKGIINEANDGVVMREATWEELSLADQVQRLRGVNQDLLQRVHGLEQYLAQLLQHDHLQGHVVAPMSYFTAPSNSGISYARRRLD